MYMGYLVILLAFAAPNEAEYQVDTVRLVVHIQANIYTYRVTNHGDSPIVGFEIPQHAIYSLKAPPDWETSDAAGTYSAWTTDPLKGIAPENCGIFSFSVSSKGATLGEASAIVRFGDGREVSIAKVWAPAAESRRYYFLIVGVLLIIFLLHYIILKHRNRRNAPSTPVA